MREPRKLRKYTAEFKANALRHVHASDRPFKAIADDLGVNHWTLRNWYRDDVAKKKKAPRHRKGTKARPGGTETAEERLKRLERENRMLRQKVESLETDREILKKAAAFFAKESE